MNAIRRKQLQKALELISEARSIIEEVRDEEENAYDNMPEGIQDSERGEAMQDNIYSLEEVMDTLEEEETIIEDVISQ